MPSKHLVDLDDLDFRSKASVIGLPVRVSAQPDLISPLKNCFATFAHQAGPGAAQVAAQVDHDREASLLARIASLIMPPSRFTTYEDAMAQSRT
ncbi:MAG: hypothetical protein IPJ28_09710 [Betaproteobacteria bacterium]|nr:hypothetical protein [Betaproteobacteria bacterium]